MQAEIVIANIGQLVTCASGSGPKRGQAMRDVGIIENAGVAIADGKFLDVGSSEDILAAYNAVTVIDAEGKVGFPGFVDPHTHIVFAGDRLDEFESKIQGTDYLDILARGGGIISTVRKTRAASFDELVELGRKRLNKMLACGTTTCEIKTGYGLDGDTEMKMLDVIAELDLTHVIDIVPTFLAAHAVPPEFRDDADGYVDLICDEMLPAAWSWYERSHFGNEQCPFFCDVFTEKNAFDITQTRRLLETAGSLGFKLKAHVDEFTNLGGSGLGIEMGATSIDHLDAISDAEIERLAGSGTIGIVTPTVNFNFGSSHYADARKLIDSGCAIAISTDYNPGSAPSPSQPMAMAIACRYQKLLPAEAINAGTINAAHAVGLGDRLGSIEAGMVADIVLADIRDYRELVYEFGTVPIDSMLKYGNIVNHRND